MQVVVNVYVDVPIRPQSSEETRNLENVMSVKNDKANGAAPIKLQYLGQRENRQPGGCRSC